ncbi:MAG: DUF2752 domain-containing protein [bacterium]
MSRASHLALTILSGLALLASVLLPLHPPDIPVCGFKRLTGYPCPFCGMTRSFTAMGHGEWAAAVQESPAGAIFYLATIGVLLASVTRLLRPAKADGLRDQSRARAVRWGVLVAGTLILLASWIYRLVMGLR